MKKTMIVVNAYDRHVISEIPEDDNRALHEKLNRAVSAFHDKKKQLKPYQRILILEKVAQLLSEREAKFVDYIVQEGGKPITDAIAEVKRAIDGIKNAKEVLRTLSGREIPMALTESSEGRIAWTHRKPRGVVVAISAFNHPLNLICHQIVPAIAVGCPVICKPAHQTPLSCIALVELFYEAGLPEAWCQTFLTSDNKKAEALATDPRIAFLSFIGSANVGWSLKSKLPRGVQCTLEHGGSAPLIVTKNATISKVIPSLLKGGYYHAGQVCVSTNRIFVDETILSEFMKQYVSEVMALTVGDPALQETKVGPLIHPSEVDRVMDWIHEAEQMGATRYGGERFSTTTLKPAVLLNPSMAAKVSTNEIFGPVTCVYPYQTLDAAIAIANTLPYAFQAAIFTSNLNEILQAYDALEATAVMVNDHTAFRVDWMPFGGLKQSGYGMGGIPETMHAMTYEKMIVLRGA